MLYESGYSYQFIVEEIDRPMSQVDKLNYIPLLFWFIILMGLLYIIVFLLFIPLVYTILKTRQNFFEEILVSTKASNQLFNILFVLLLNIAAPFGLAEKHLAVCGLADVKKSIFAKK
jgi:hypothetical protein